jgi:hypothetical protein
MIGLLGPINNLCYFVKMYTKAVGCSEAMHAAVEWGMGDIHLETNSRVLVCALQNSDYDPAPKGVLFRDIHIVL